VRARRFLDLTGLDADGLRAAIGEPATHLAVLDFLCAHEPDLVAAAEALGMAPAELAAARDRLAS
jgi:adenine/guanine phosphoribosyltransferase-like PRPP-binding protein